MKLHFEGAEIRKYSTLLETIFYGSEVIQNGERVPISKLRPIDYKLFVKGEFMGIVNHPSDIPLKALELYSEDLRENDIRRTSIEDGITINIDNLEIEVKEASKRH